MNRIAKFFQDYSLARFLLPIGLGLIIFGIIFMGIVNKRSDYPEIDAEVSSVELAEGEHYEGESLQEATYRVMVRYTADGQEYEEELGILSKKMKVGEKVRINYNPDNPREIGTPTGMVLPIVMIAAGCAALAAGIISIINTRAKNKALKEQEEGWKNGD